jgi:hypothetical protein
MIRSWEKAEEIMDQKYYFPRWGGEMGWKSDDKKYEMKVKDELNFMILIMIINSDVVETTTAKEWQIVEVRGEKENDVTLEAR